MAECLLYQCFSPLKKTMSSFTASCFSKKKQKNLKYQKKRRFLSKKKHNENSVPLQNAQIRVSRVSPIWVLLKLFTYKCKITYCIADYIHTYIQTPAQTTESISLDCKLQRFRAVRSFQIFQHLQIFPDISALTDISRYFSTYRYFQIFQHLQKPFDWNSIFSLIWFAGMFVYIYTSSTAWLPW